MDKKTFFHKVSQMRTAQREYFKTRSSAALASSKLLERQIDEEIKRAKAIMAAKAKLLKCALYVSPQVYTTYSNQRCTRAMWYAWTETRSTPMSLSGARNTRLSWHVASRQRQDLQTLPHSYRLK